MSRYLYKKIQNISPESLNFQHSGLKLTTLRSDPNVGHPTLIFSFSVLGKYTPFYYIFAGHLTVNSAWHPMVFFLQLISLSYQPQ